MRLATPVARDRALAAATVAIGTVEVSAAANREGALWLNILFIAAIGGLLLWRRRHALAAGALAYLLVIGMQATLTPVEEIAWPMVPLLLFAYAFGAHLPRERAWLGIVLSLAAVAGVNLQQDDLVVTGDYVFPGTFALLAWIAGRLVRSRGMLVAELHEAALRAEEARDHEAAQAVAEERRRIARELHDVVAHSMSVMVVQAGGARRILERDPPRAEAAAAQIERTGREALGEMRRLLGVVGGDEGSRTPQPQLDGLNGLVERARDAGLPVQLRLTGDRPAIPAGVELAAYRIVQEGLTNAIKHAASAPTRVTVHYGDEQVEVTVENDAPDSGAPAFPPADGHEPGHGLLGMRERVRVFGGELHTGALEGGGFSVHATLPLGQ